MNVPTNLATEDINQIKDILKGELANAGKPVDESIINNAGAIKHFITTLDTLPDLRQPFKALIEQNKQRIYQQKLSEIENLYGELISDINTRYKDKPDYQKIAFNKLNKLKQAEIKRLDMPLAKLQLEDLQKSKIKNDGISNMAEPFKSALINAVRAELGADCADLSVLSAVDDKLSDSARESAKARAHQIDECQKRWDAIKNKGGKPINPKAELILFHLITGAERLGLKPVSTLDGWTHKIMQIIYRAHGLPIVENSEKELIRAMSQHRKRQQAIKSAKPFR